MSQLGEDVFEIARPGTRKVMKEYKAGCLTRRDYAHNQYLVTISQCMILGAVNLFYDLLEGLRWSQAYFPVFIP